MCLSRLRAARQLLDCNDEVVDAGAVRAVGPFAAVADAVDFVVEADGAASRDVGLNRRGNMVRNKIKRFLLQEILKVSVLTSAERWILLRSISMPCPPSSRAAHSLSLRISMACSRAQSSTRLRSGMFL